MSHSNSIIKCLLECEDSEPKRMTREDWVVLVASLGCAVGVTAILITSIKLICAALCR